MLAVTLTFYLLLSSPLYSVVPTITEEPAQIAGIAGDTVNFSCSATGYPLPDIVWYTRGGREVNDSGKTEVIVFPEGNTVQSVLRFTFLQLAHVGSYYCTAGNNLVLAALDTSRESNLTVLCKCSCFES